jgi:hypothetical protein
MFGRVEFYKTRMPMSRAFRDMGASVIEDSAVISVAGLRAYFSHERLTICTSVMVMCPCSVLPFFM